jgi:membrane protease YdiL (CAAX protease family)
MTSVMVVQAQVIAAPAIIDQSPASSPAQYSSPVEPALDLEPDNSSASQPDGRSSSFIHPSEIVVAIFAAAGLLLFFGRRWHRLGNAPQRHPVLTTMAAFALFIAMYLAARVGATIALRFVDISVNADGTLPELRMDQIGIIQIGVYVGQAIVAALYVWLIMRAGMPSQEARPSVRKASAVGAIAILFAWPAAITAAALAALAGGERPDAISHDLLEKMVTGPRGMWLIVLGVQAVIAAPIMEEITYRGILQRGMVDAGVPRWVSIFFASAMFAAMHLHSVEPHAIAALFVLSLGFGYVYERTGRLIAPIVMHMVFNAGNLLIALLGPIAMQ